MEESMEKTETRMRFEAGFTLLEVLAAISIFMIGILAIASMQASALRGNSASMGMTEAVNAGQAMVERIMAMPFDPSTFPSTPQQETYTSALGEQYTIEWQADDGDPGDGDAWHDLDGDGTNDAAEITVTVSWGDVMGQRSVVFNFMKTTQF